MNNWSNDATTEIKPKNPKSSWVKDPNGDYDGVPREYLSAEKDSALDSSRKNPWD